MRLTEVSAASGILGGSEDRALQPLPLHCICIDDSPSFFYLAKDDVPLNDGSEDDTKQGVRSEILVSEAGPLLSKNNPNH